MKQIKILCQDSALIIMVGTHCENMQPDHITSTSHSIRNRFPKHKFPNFQNQILPVSAKSGIGIRELKKALVQLANECTIQLTVPVSWVQLYETIKVKFKIIFQMQEGIKFLVPSLLPSARPASELMKIFPEKLPHNKLSLGRVFRFGQLPIELFSRLMVAILYLPNVEGIFFFLNFWIIIILFFMKLIFFHYNF